MSTTTARPTLAQIKRTVTVGTRWAVTNHYITREDHPSFGTREVSIVKVTGSSIQFGDQSWAMPWPKAAQVQMDADGTIRLYGGGAAQSADELFLTLVPVVEGATEVSAQPEPADTAPEAPAPVSAAAEALIVRRVARGYDRAESARLLAAIMGSIYSDETKALDLAYRGFATDQQAARFVAEHAGRVSAEREHAGLTPVPVPARGSGPIACSDSRCSGHRAHCLFGATHVWATWYENGRLMRTADTYHCHRCGGVCVGEEPERPAAPVSALEHATCTEVHPDHADMRCEREPRHSGACVADGPERYVWAARTPHPLGPSPRMLARMERTGQVSAPAKAEAADQYGHESTAWRPAR